MKSTASFFTSEFLGKYQSDILFREQALAFLQRTAYILFLPFYAVDNLRLLPLGKR